jgi:hypothetical protein
MYGINNKVSCKYLVFDQKMDNTPDLHDFHSQQASSLFKDGVTTFNGYYLSGNFFQLFFDDLINSRCYYLKLNLTESSDTEIDRYLYVDKLSFNRVCTKTVRALGRNLNKAKFGQFLLTSLPELESFLSTYGSVNEYINIKTELFSIPNREKLELLLVFLSANQVKFEVSLEYEEKLVQERHELCLRMLKSQLEICKAQGVTESEIEKLLNEVY